MATAPSCGAGTVTKDPLNYPCQLGTTLLADWKSTFAVGVLDALRIYASLISCRAEVVALKCLWTWDKRNLDADEGLLMEDMAYRKDILTGANQNTLRGTNIRIQRAEVKNTEK
jgi:hypothetical protein